MCLKNLVENKFRLFTYAALFLVPFYTWKTLYDSYTNLKNNYIKELLFKKKHNCVVIYSEFNGMSGWPPNAGRIKVNLNKENCLNGLREPIINFIDTANKSLDLAFMLISVNSIYEALIRAHFKGVKVRILLNFEHCETKFDAIRNLMKKGIEILTYVSQGLNSIMHYKYCIKDYTESSGFVLMGSLNLTESGFISNYEDVVFTSNQYIAKAFHEDFEECWSFVKIKNEELINKTALLDANLL